jgi:molybdenum cofactor biosynthesis protein B
MPTPSSDGHQRAAAGLGPIEVAIVTVSDTRTAESDANGRWLRERIIAAGHLEVGYRLIPDEPELVAAVLDELASGSARVILFNGGTGISRRDTTYDALADRLEKTIPGFGELFRMLSWSEIGAAAMLSRAVAGVYRGTVVISTPGSPAAVRLAWEKLIEPELAHLVSEVAR